MSRELKTEDCISESDEITTIPCLLNGAMNKIVQINAIGSPKFLGIIKELTNEGMTFLTEHNKWLPGEFFVTSSAFGNSSRKVKLVCSYRDEIDVRFTSDK